MLSRVTAVAVLVATLVFLLLPGVAGAASAGSIVYAAQGNVWIANPDGAARYQVTRDGTAELPYYSPTQADDGTIVALHRVARGTRRPALIVHLRQNGSLLGKPFETNSPLGGVTAAAVSPDGAKVGYTFAVAGNVSWQDLDGNTYVYHDTTTLTDFTAAGRLTGVGFNAGSDIAHRGVAWMGPNRALLINQQNLTLDYVDRGGSPPRSWFEFCEVYPDPTADECAGYPVEGGGNTHDGGVIVGAATDRRGSRLATINALFDPSATESTYHHRLIFYAGGKPLSHPVPKCGTGIDPTATRANADEGTVVSWAPDGRSVAFDWSDGIHVAELPTLENNCEGNSERLILPGAHSPSWGPAPVAPGPRGSRTPPARVRLPNGLRLGKVRAARQIPVLCTMKLAGRCQVRLFVTPATARRLGLPVRRGGPLLLGKKTGRFGQAGRKRLAVKLTRRVAKALRHTRRLRLTIRAVATAPGYSKTITTTGRTIRR